MSTLTALRPHADCAYRIDKTRLPFMVLLSRRHESRRGHLRGAKARAMRQRRRMHPGASTLRAVFALWRWQREIALVSKEHVYTRAEARGHTPGSVFMGLCASNR